MFAFFRLCFIISVIFFISAPIFAYYDVSTPVEGDSIANDALQFKVINKLYKNLSVSNSTCYDFSIKNTQLLHYPYDVKKKNNKYVKGYWKELWTVNICGSYKQFPITFYINANETNFNIDENSLSD